MVPGAPVPQEAVAALAETILAEQAPDLVRYLPVFRNTGIETRHFVRDPEWYLRPLGWKERSAAFEEGGLALLERATRQILADTGVAAHEVDGIVFVTTTGIATPSLDALLCDRVGFRDDVHRVPVWGLGCAGGVAGLRLAADLAKARPGSRYLLLCLELCSLSFRLEDFSVRSFVANALFSDGCAAALVSSHPDAEGPRLGAGASHRWPDSRDVMGWTVEEDGLGVVFSRHIPDILRKGLAGAMERFFDDTGDRPARHILHPGGTKVLEAYQDAMALEPDAVEDAWAVLRRYGNMSSPTVLFVLERALRRGLDETACLAAVGPGFSAEMLLMHPATTGARTAASEAVVHPVVTGAVEE